MLNLNVKKLATNTGWLLLEKLLRVVAALFVGIMVSRYLGPEKFGQLSYTISLVTILAMLCHLGLEGLTVRRFVKFPNEAQETFSTAIGLKLFGAVFAFAILTVFVFLTEPVASPQFWLLLVAGLYIFIEPVLVSCFWFESQVQGKYAALARMFGLVIASILKLILIATGASILWFGVAFAVEAILCAVALIFLLVKRSSLSLNATSFDTTLAKSMMSQGWMVMFGAIFAAIYHKVDQSMLMWMDTPQEVGIYAVAAQLSEVWGFIPVAIIASLYPSLIKLKERDPDRYQFRLQQAFDFLALLSIGLAVVVSFIAQDLILLLYGEEYRGAGIILQIHIWSCIFVFYRALFSKWIHIEQVLMFSLITQGIGAISNVLLNYWLIPLYGAKGAAMATLISYGCASFLCLFAHYKTRIVFWMMLKSLFVWLRLPWVVKGYYYLVKVEK